MKFRKRPVAVEAVQWRNRMVVCPPGPPWFVEAEEQRRIDLHGDRLSVKTPGGVMVAMPGDWVVRGPDGRLWVVEGDVFDLLYEPAE